MPSHDVCLGELGGVRLVGEGGHGVVYQLLRHGDLLLKVYHEDVAVDACELGVLIELPSRFTAADRRLVTTWTAWPRGRVFDRGRCVGLLMRPAPARFTTTLPAGRKLLELQFLMYPRRAMWQELTLPTPGRRRYLAMSYARMFQVLHGNGVLVGDVSMRNLLWTLTGEPAVFALDCDGFRVLGRRPALGPVATAGWRDPATRPDEQTLDSDRYKLALVVVRLLLADHAVIPGGRRCRQLDRALAALARRAAVPGERPTAGQWLRALNGGTGLVQRESWPGEHARYREG